MSTKADQTNSEGHMTIRRALFLGGAVLVLAACADATAPMGSAKQGGSVAAAKKGPSPSTTNKTTNNTPTATDTETCRGGGGYVVGSGRTTSDTTSTCTDQ